MTSSRAGALFGAIGVLAVPVGVLAAQALTGLTLIRGLYYGIPVALVLGVGALVVSRRARFAAQRSVFVDRAGPLRTARVLGWLALYIGITAGIAVAVYWVLRARH
ncbi:MAG TPA: hypothetical protein VGU02_08160 [Gaiellaceae bacterium]|nr:hypothetical protein [Gaiellaceae bacterium]